MKKVIVFMGLIFSVLVLPFCITGCHEHDMQSRVLADSTCKKNGEIEYYCAHCDYTDVAPIPASHDYQMTVAKEATCRSEGELNYICKDCGASYTESIPEESHTYVKGLCSVCGSKEVVKSDIEPNEWYTFGTSELIKAQNIDSVNYTPIGNHTNIMVTFKPVCQYCHALSSMPAMCGVSKNDPHLRTYFCEFCEKRTYVRIEYYNG